MEQASVLIRQPKAVIYHSQCTDSSPLLLLPMIWGKTLDSADVWPASNSKHTYSVSVSSTPCVWHANRNHSPCKRERRTSFIPTGTPLLIDSLFVLKGASLLVGCWGEIAAAKYSSDVKKACQVFGVFKTSLLPLPPASPVFACVALR